MTKTGRNDPCSCGSGRKYKQCCAQRSSSEPPAPIGEARRDCGGCTACCDGWLQITVAGRAVRPGQPCPHSSGQGCTIYPTRPRDPCREFICGWLAPGSPLPDWMRPDRAKVILLGPTWRWRGLRVDVAVPVGDAPDDRSLRWLKERALSESRPLLYQSSQDWYAFGPPEFQLEMKERIARGERLWS